MTAISKKTVVSALKEISQGQAEASGERFATTTFIACLLKAMHGSSPEFAALVDQALGEAGEIATNASEAIKSTHTTHALGIIDGFRTAITGAVSPKKDAS